MNEVILDRVMSNPKIKNLGLRKEVILSILRVYDEVAFNILLENGNITLDNDMNIEVVKLLDRVHVLRGTPYKSSRKYKLKLSMGDETYKRIEAYYDKLLEDIM